MSTIRKPLALRITAEADCYNCGGTGFNIKNEHNRVSNYIEVKIVVCGCVRLAPRPRVPKQGVTA